MSKLDPQRLSDLENGLASFSDGILPLPGIDDPSNLNSLACQFIDSIHRVEYVRTIAGRSVSPSRADPSSNFFDPFKAAIYYRNQGKLEEAFWLVFLATHFGKHGRSGWRLLRNIYGALGDSIWAWTDVSPNPEALGDWISVNYPELIKPGVKASFGNHRKYESIKPGSAASTGAVISSYVTWVNSHGGHLALFQRALVESSGDPRLAFRYLYNGMLGVKRFGRTGKFDFLTMIAKLGLANIEADSAYLSDNATGPLRGSRLLFGGAINSNLSAETLEKHLALLANHLNVGMQEMEDALCNWQKSPAKFKRFSG